jgi:hypothetical protein
MIFPAINLHFVRTISPSHVFFCTAQPGLFAAQDGFKRLAQEHGKPLPAQLLEALLGMACIGAMADWGFTKVRDKQKKLVVS